jgi:hypothetical protein
MKKLYEAADRIEAQMLCDELAQVGVEAVILGDYLAGAAGELPTNIWPAVWVVEDTDFYRAQQILQGFTKNHKNSPAEGSWHCRNCGEMVDAVFEICWNCATPRNKVD